MGFPKRYTVYFDETKPVYWLNKGRNALSKGSVYECGIWIKRCLRSARPYLNEKEKVNKKKKVPPKPLLKRKIK